MKAWCLLAVVAVVGCDRVAEELQQAAPIDATIPKIEFCRTDADCRVAQGPGLARDSRAVCNTELSRCQCSTGFTSRDIGGVVHYNCYPVTNSVGEIRSLLVRILLKIYFRLGNCVLARANTVQSQFVAVVMDVLGLPTSRLNGRTNVCGSVNAGVDVQMTLEEMSTKLPSFDDDLNTAVQSDRVLRDVFGSAPPVTEATTVEDNECELDYATKTAFLVTPGGGGLCSALECAHGQPFLLSTTDVYTCAEPVKTSDDDLTDGAIVGIVLGSLALCCVLLALCFCLVKRSDPEQESEQAVPRTPRQKTVSEVPPGKSRDPFDEDSYSTDDMAFSDVHV